MDFRTKRQLAVLGVVLLFLILAGGLAVYRFLPSPTCFDNKQNQGEEGVDCGGPCLPCALKEQKPIQVFWARFVPTRANAYDVAAEVKNPNLKLAARSFEYEFKLFDTNGVLVASRRGSSFLYPGELAHLVEIGLSSGRIIDHVELDIADPSWELTESLPPDVIAAAKTHTVKTSDDTAFSMVTARLENRTLVDIPYLEVNTLVFDSDGNLLGGNRTVAENLRAGEMRPVSFQWPVSFGDRVASIIVEPRIPFVSER